MTVVKLLFSLALLASLVACGGSEDITCNDPSPYQLAMPGKRVTAPDGLDNLETIKEMPLPEASPSKPRSADSPCLDRPPGGMSDS